MKKGGFTIKMYTTKGKTKTSLYKNFEQNFPKHRDVEIQAYVAYAVERDMSSKMQSTIRGMTKMIVRELFKEAN